MYDPTNVLHEFKKELEDLGYNVVYIGLYGSQNYNIHDSMSDVDARAIVIPTLDQLLIKKHISTKFEFAEGQVDVKDLMFFYDNCIVKGNFSFIEAMQTDYWIGEQSIRDMFESCKINIKSIWGAIVDKTKKFEKEADTTVRQHMPTFDGTSICIETKNISHAKRLYDLFFIYLNDDTKCFHTYDIDARNNMILNKRKVYLTGGNAENFISAKVEEHMKYADEVKKLIPNGIDNYEFKTHVKRDDVVELYKELFDEFYIKNKYKKEGLI